MALAGAFADLDTPATTMRLHSRKAATGAGTGGIAHGVNEAA